MQEDFFSYRDDDDLKFYQQMVFVPLARNSLSFKDDVRCAFAWDVLRIVAAQTCTATG